MNRLELSGDQASIVVAEVFQAYAVARRGAALWIGAGAEPTVSFVDETGLHVAAAAPGQGPEEFVAPVAMTAHDAAAMTGVVAWDPGNNRLSLFRKDGKVATSAHLPPFLLRGVRSDLPLMTWGHPLRMRGVGRWAVVARYKSGVNFTSDLWEGELGTVALADSAGGIRVGDFTPLFAFSSLPGYTVGRERPLLGGVPMWDVCDREIIVVDGVTGDALWIDLEGKVLRRLRAPMAAGPHSKSFIKRYLTAMIVRESRGAMTTTEAEVRAGVALRRAGAQFAEQAPAAVDVLCGADGSVWTQAFQANESPLGMGRLWLRMVDQEWEEVLLPPGFQPLMVDQAAVVGVYSDTVGVQSLVSIPTQESGR